MDKFTGTMPVSEARRFDVAALARWMSANVEGFRASGPGGGLRAEQFAGGQSNPTFRLTAGDGTRYVMRTKPARKADLLPSAHAIEREFKVQSALAKAGFPVPRLHGLCEDEDRIGRAFYVMEAVEGRVLWDPQLPGMAPAERGAIYDEMCRVIALLHTLDPAALGLGDFGRPGNYFARQIDRWTRQYRASETETIPAMEHLIGWLPAHVPPGEETSLVHGDFRIDNVIFHPSEPRILAVLDWELSTLGHPLADLSYHAMVWHQPHDRMRGLRGLDLPTLGIPAEAEFVAAYCRRTGRAGVGDWDFCLAYNFFRIASILQGVYKRGLDGIASSTHALEEGKRAKALAEIGRSFAEGAPARG